MSVEGHTQLCWAWQLLLPDSQVGKGNPHLCGSPGEESRETRSRETPALLQAVLCVLKKQQRKKVGTEMLPEICKLCQGGGSRGVTVTPAANAWEKGQGVGAGIQQIKGWHNNQKIFSKRTVICHPLEPQTHFPWH